MLTRAEVMESLLRTGAMRIGPSTIRRLMSFAISPLAAADQPMWIVRTWEGQKFEFLPDEVIKAVDTFIDCQPNYLEFPDADKLREMSRQDKEAEYKSWCEQLVADLQGIAKLILQAQEEGKHTISFDITPDNERNLRRFFAERHYRVTIQDKQDGSGFKVCTLDWMPRNIRRR